MTLVDPYRNGSADRSIALMSERQKPPSSKPSVSPTAEQLMAWLRSKLATTLDMEALEIDLQQDLTEYGLNSIEAVNLTGELEKLLGRRLSPTLVWDYPSVQALAQHLTADSRLANQHRADTTHNGLAARSLGDKETGNFAPLSSASNLESSNAVLPEIPAKFYRFEASLGYQQLQQRLETIQDLGISNPFFTVQEGIVNDRTQINGQEFINYATYNYLGMCGDPVVTQAAQAAIEQYGTSACASRLLSGEKPLHRQLEQAIAEFVGTEDSIVYVGGHATNVTTISHLFGHNDLIVHDAFSHNSILQGCQLSGATILAFPHNDWQALDQLLRDRRHRYQRVLIVIEGVYSTDGDISNLPQFIELKKRHKTYLMVDEAHSIGVLGQGGRGIGEYFGVNPADVDLWMGTLSKSLASCGGYIAASQAIVEYLKYTSPGFVYSVGISPPNAAATLAALQVLKIDSERVTRLHQRSQYFLALAQEHGLNTGLSKGSPVIPIIVGEAMKSIELSQRLFRKGINVPFMIYPSVPQNAARLRFFITCTHSVEQIRFTVDSLASEVAAMG